MPYPTTNNVGVKYTYDTANGQKTIVDAINALVSPVPFWTYTYTLDGNQAVKTATDPVNTSASHSYARNTLDQLTGDTARAPPTRDGAMTAPIACPRAPIVPPTPRRR